LINVSGFHVDPGFHGHLKFAVYNAGSNDITLAQDQSVFVIWYADLDAPSPDPYPALPPVVPPHGRIISAKDIDRLKGQVSSPAELKKQLDALEKSIDIKFNATEQTRQFIRAVLLIVLAIVGKMYLDGTKIELREGNHFLVGAGIVGACILVGDFLVLRARKKEQSAPRRD